jgi:phosphonate transport system substrate-binding protein
MEIKPSPEINSQQLKSTRSLRNLKVILGLVLVALVFVSFYNVIKSTLLDRKTEKFSPKSWVKLEENKDVVPDSAFTEAMEDSAIRVAVAPIVSPEKSLEMYQDFVEYLARKLGRKPVALYRPTYTETNDLIRYRRCDLAIVCTYPFIRGEREFGLQALVVPEVKGSTTYRSVILVRQSSNAVSILDLRGKRFASGDYISTTGWLYPAMLLMAAKEDPRHFFSEHVITGSHDRSLQAVADGFVDGAAVHGLVYDQMIEENPAYLRNVRVLIESPPFAIPPVAVHPDLNQTLRREIQNVLIEMHNEEAGRRALRKMHVDRFVVPEKGVFDSLRKSIGELEGWRK